MDVVGIACGSPVYARHLFYYAIQQRDETMASMLSGLGTMLPVNLEDASWRWLEQIGAARQHDLIHRLVRDLDITLASHVDRDALLEYLCSAPVKRCHAIRAHSLGVIRVLKIYDKLGDDVAASLAAVEARVGRLDAPPHNDDFTIANILKFANILRRYIS